MRMWIAPCLLAFTLVACSTPENTMSKHSTAASGSAAPLRRLNPTPKRAYRITMTITDAPGPFASVEGISQYDAQNYKSCGESNNATGTRMRITSNEPFKLEKLSATEYQGTIYLDLLIDDDYFGNGVCHWELTEVRALLRATGSNENTEYIPRISSGDIASHDVEKKYFWNGYYPRANSANFAEFGQTSLSNVPPDKRGEFFEIAVTAKELSP